MYPQDSLTAANNAFGSGLSLGALGNPANQLSALSSLAPGGGLGLAGQANAVNNLMQHSNASVGSATGSLSGVNMNQSFQK